jgi:hypothetical protein
VGWLVLILVLLAAAFGVLGAVIKVTAFLILTILLTLTVLVAVAWYGVRAQVRRWQHEAAGRGGGVQSWTWSRGSTTDRTRRDLPSHDDRY